MKKQNDLSKLFEIVVPFEDAPEGSVADGLFDDCPFCRQLKASLESGSIEKIPLQVETDDNDLQ